MSEQKGLPKGWVRCTLGDLMQIIRGVSYSKPQASNEASDNRVPILRATNINGRLDFDNLVYVPKNCVSKEQMLRLGDVVIAASSGSKEVVGKAAQLLESWIGSFGAFCMGIRPFPEIESRFVAYFLQTKEYRLTVSQLSAGSNINNLKRSHIQTLPIELAPRKEQGRIVAMLDELFSDLDAGVAALERAQANLTRYRAAVLKAAVEGRLTEKWRAEHPDIEPASELVYRIETPPRPNRYKTRSKDIIQGHSALSVGNTGTTLPRGWVWSPLVDVARMETGHTPSRRHPEWWVGNIPWIGIADAREYNGRRIFDTIQHTNKDGLANSAARLLPADTVCISRTASVGYVVVMQQPMATSQDFVNWVPTPAVLPDWLRIVFMADREALRRFGKGSVHKTIYFPEWLSMYVAVPPLEEQAAIVQEVDRCLSANDIASSILATNFLRASRLRHSILQRAFEGNLVPQDVNEESADVLLERIRAARPVEVSRQTSAKTPGSKRDKPKLPKGIRFKQAAIASYAIDALCDRPEFGRTQLEKVMYLTQHGIGVDLALQFKRKVAGPFDESLRKIESLGRKQSWFVARTRSSGKGTYYRRGKRIANRCRAAKTILGDHLPKMDWLLAEFAKMDTEQAELLATVFAAWNDLAIDGRKATNDNIIRVVHGWHEEKQRFKRSRIVRCIKWLHDKSFVPAGIGPKTLVVNESDS